MPFSWPGLLPNEIDDLVDAARIPDTFAHKLFYRFEEAAIKKLPAGVDKVRVGLLTVRGFSVSINFAFFLPLYLS